MFIELGKSIISEYQVESTDDSMWTVTVYEDGTASVFATLEYLTRFYVESEDLAVEAIESGMVLDQYWQSDNNSTTV